MKPCTVRGLTIGSGLPKICVPIVGKTEEEILAQADVCIKTEPDLIEWRIDWFEGPVREKNEAALCRVAEMLRRKCADIALLLTFRTKAEGGYMDLAQEQYHDLIRLALTRLPVDLIDIELVAGEMFLQEATDLAEKNGKKVILSYHDFTKTPDAETLLRILKTMESTGADIAKVAVMPGSPEEVLRLMTVTERFTRQASIPAITMSMGAQGLVSRLSGAVTGSSVTFGSASQASAPGQIPVQNLRQIIETLGPV